MDTNALRALQQPLKDAYRADPAQAPVTLRAEGELGAETISCSVATGRALAEAGLHPGSGGGGSLACSGDMVLQALVACAGASRCGRWRRRWESRAGPCTPKAIWISAARSR